MELFFSSEFDWGYSVFYIFETTVHKNENLIFCKKMLSPKVFFYLIESVIRRNEATYSRMDQGWMDASGDHISSNFLKAVFHKFYLVPS